MHQYINLRAEYGFSQTYTMDYCSIQDIIDQMDRLGIWQTIVEFTGASNTIYRAHRLLKELETIPNWRQRIIPCFMADPAVLFHTGGVEEFRQILRDAAPCCLSFYPKAGKYRIRMADALLEQVQDICSVVLMDKAQLSGDCAADDLIYLADRFPKMSFVIRQFSWGGYNFIIDVLSRTKNVYIDNSRLHTREAIDMFSRHFGSNRIVFSTDTRANEGAAMGTITFSELSEEEKNAIRYGNFISMFQNEEDRAFLLKNLRAIPNKIPNRFWTPFVEEGKAPDTEIYDIHCHMGMTGGGWVLEDGIMEKQVESFEKDMDRYNVQKIVSSMSGRPDLIQANIEMEEATRGRDRFRGYLRYNPNFDELYTDEYMDKLFATGYFVGLKTLPAYMGIEITDPRYERMFRYANEHELPVLIHTWQKSLGAPKACAEAAARWPKAKVVLGHSGGGELGRVDCEAIAQDPKFNNVYFEFCGSFAASRTWAKSLEKIDPSRVLYGTDACLHDMGWEMGRLLSADIGDEDLTAILGANAKRVYGF